MEENQEENKLHKQTVPFTQIANEILNAKDLSFKAKGLFAYMHSKPDGWNFTLRSMAKQVKEGRDSIANGIEELKKYGLIEYTKNNDGSGKYELFHSVSREPKPNPENPDPSRPA